MNTTSQNKVVDTVVVNNTNNNMENTERVATPNAVMAETANANPTNSKDMNHIINFTNVWSEAEVTRTASVHQEVVKDLFNAFMAIPQEVIVTFKNEGGFLKMVVKMNHRDKFYRTFETYADAKLVESMIGAMRGDRIGALEVYKTEEHPLEASEVDPRLDIFTQFINSPLRCRFEADFLAGNGDRYVLATFNIAYRKQIKFCLKRTEEVEAIINNAIQAA